MENLFKRKLSISMAIITIAICLLVITRRQFPAISPFLLIKSHEIPWNPMKSHQIPSNPSACNHTNQARPRSRSTSIWWPSMLMTSAAQGDVDTASASSNLPTRRGLTLGPDKYVMCKSCSRKIYCCVHIGICICNHISKYHVYIYIYIYCCKNRLMLSNCANGNPGSVMTTPSIILGFHGPRTRWKSTHLWHKIQSKNKISSCRSRERDSCSFHFMACKVVNQHQNRPQISVESPGVSFPCNNGVPPSSGIGTFPLR